MVNVGLRAYIWSQKTHEQQQVREFWNLNGVTYKGFRAFVEFIKDDGFPELYFPSRESPAVTQSPSVPTLHSHTDHDDGASEVSVRSSHSSLSHASSMLNSSNIPATQRHSHQVGNAFASAKHMFDLDDLPVTVVRFARSGSSLIAMGLANGAIKIATLDEPPRVLKHFRGHNGGVADLDWSPDNLLLLTAGTDGTVVVWNVMDAQAVRALSLGKQGAAAPCCRFHPVNPNLYFVGAANGTVQIQNCSTGITVATVETLSPAGQHVAPAAMAATPNMLCIGDAAGYLHIWRAEIRDGQLQPLQLLCRNPPPKGTSGELTSLQYINFCKTTGGPALLSGSMDGSVCIWDLDTWTGRPKLKGRSKLLQAEGKLRASMNSMLMPSEPQYMTVNAQGNQIEVYDISSGFKKTSKLIAKLTAHASRIMDVSWSSGAAMLASSDAMGTVIVWELATRL